MLAAWRYDLAQVALIGDDLPVADSTSFRTRAAFIAPDKGYHDGHKIVKIPRDRPQANASKRGGGENNPLIRDARVLRFGGQPEW